MNYRVFGRGALHSIIIDILTTEAYQGFYDDNVIDDSCYMGSFQDGINEIADDCEYFLGFAAIANMPYRKYLTEIISSCGKLEMNCIHPRAVVSSSTMLGGGAIVCGSACLGVNVTIGKSIVVFSNSSIEHDSIIGDNVNIAPGVTICGSVTVGDNVFIGAGSTLIDGVKVGSGTIIGAGSTVITDLEPDSLYIGAPARRIKQNDLYRHDYSTF